MAAGSSCTHKDGVIFFLSQKKWKPQKYSVLPGVSSRTVNHRKLWASSFQVCMWPLQYNEDMRLECVCCRDVSRIPDKINGVENSSVTCITEHPGFNSIWVL